MKLPSNKSFGITFGTVFALIFFYLYLTKEVINIYLILFSLIFFILGLFNSKVLNPFNLIWFKFGIFLGKVISPIILGLIFFLVVTPTGLFMKIIKKDLLSLKFNNNKSYWIEKKDYKSKMKNQF